MDAVQAPSAAHGESRDGRLHDDAPDAGSLKNANSSELQQPRRLRVSFASPPGGLALAAHSEFEVLAPPSPPLPHDRPLPSPLLGGGDILTRQSSGIPSAMERTHPAASDPAHSAMLIYPKRIDDLRRFRMLFVGVLLFIVSSTQGVHSLFGVLLMQSVYRYDVQDMMTVYLCGTAFGMFVLPFGALYDWFGPRVVVVLGTLLTALGHLLFGLMFSNHISHTVAHSAVFYAIMSWGCYALDVAVMPAVLTHMPRDRGQPTGLLQTFSGLGSSFISCLFRGFFNNHFDYLMWFMLAMTLACGALGAWYMEDAPYVTTRWQQRRQTPRQQLKCYLIRNRYMSQLVPKRRFYCVTAILVVLNFYLTIQAVTVAYLADQMTMGKYRGIAIGAVLITVSCVILAVPIRAIDGLSPQDKEVIQAAKEKEDELHRLRRSHWRTDNEPLGDEPPHDTHEPVEGPLASAQPRRTASYLRRFEPVVPTRPLLEVEIEDVEEAGEGSRSRPDAPHADRRGPDPEPCLRLSMVGPPPGDRQPSSGHSEDLLLMAREPSTYGRPHVEAIHICGEVFVAPVYQTTFLQSLTYIDIWLIFYTTLCVWGIGITMTGNFNIQVMVRARFAGMDYKLYILFAAMSGVCTAGGRVFLGLYELTLGLLREHWGISVCATAAYPLASIGLFIGCIFWIALPGDKVLIMAYIIGPAFYGFSSSMTIYVLGTIFDRDIGMHYGFCYLGASIGMVLFYYLSWFLTYQNEAMLIPGAGKICIGRRACMNKAIGIYLAIIFSTIFTSYAVHWRYAQLVRGKLKHRRIIRRTIRRLIRIASGDAIDAGSVASAPLDHERTASPSQSRA